MNSDAHYMATIYARPSLEPEEELRLARAWYWCSDIKAGEKLIEAYLKLVPTFARKKMGYKLSFQDLVAHGNTGLTLALWRFDPERGIKFGTYARWWINEEMNDFIIETISLVNVRTTAGQRKAFYRLRGIMKRLGIMTIGRTALESDEVTRLSEALEVSEDDIVQVHRILQMPDESMDAPIGHDGSITKLDVHASDDPSPEDIAIERSEARVRAVEIAVGMKALTDTERWIIENRRLTEDPAHLTTLGNKRGVTREAIRQSQVRAQRKMGKAIRLYRKFGIS